MLVRWKEVWHAGLTMVKVFGSIVVAWLLVGLFWPFSLTNWSWGLVLLGCAVLTGFWRSWKRSSFLGALLGVVLAICVLVVVVVASTWRLQPEPLGELIAGFVYASASAAIATTIGFYLGRLVLSLRVRGRA